MRAFRCLIVLLIALGSARGNANAFNMPFKGGAATSAERALGGHRAPWEKPSGERFPGARPGDPDVHPAAAYQEKIEGVFDERLRNTTRNRSAQVFDDLPYVRVRLPDSPGHDAVFIERVRAELVQKIGKDDLDVLNLVDDAPTDAFLKKALPDDVRARSEKLRAFLRGTGEQITAARLASVLDGFDGHVIVMLGHIDDHGALVYRGANGQQRTLPLAVIREAELAASAHVLVLGCDSGRTMPVGASHAINSVHVAERLQHVFRSEIRSFKDLYGTLSSVDLQFIVNPADLRLARRIDIADGGGNVRGAAYWFAPAAAQAGRANSGGPALVAAESKAGALSSTAVTVVAGFACSLMFGWGWALSHRDGAWRLASRIVASVLAHVLAFLLLAGLILDAIAGDWSPWTAFIVAGLALAGASWCGSQASKPGPIRAFQFAGAVRLGAIALTLAVAGGAQVAYLIDRYPALPATMLSLVEVAARVPDPMLFALSAMFSLYLLLCACRLVRPIAHWAIPDYWKYRLLWLIHPALVESIDLRDLRTYSQWRRDYRQSLDATLLRCGLVDPALRRRAVRAQLLMYDEISRTISPVCQLMKTRNYGEIVVPDPWTDGHPRTFSLQGVRVQAGSTNRLLQTPAKDNAPEVVALVCGRTGREHFLPRALTEHWRAGAIPSEHVAPILFQLEQLVKRGDFLPGSTRRARIKRITAWSIAMLWACGVGAFYGVESRLFVTQPAWLIALEIAPVLALPILFQWPFVHWRRLANAARALALRLGAEGRTA